MESKFKVGDRVKASGTCRCSYSSVPVIRPEDVGIIRGFVGEYANPSSEKPAGYIVEWEKEHPLLRTYEGCKGRRCCVARDSDLEIAEPAKVTVGKRVADGKMSILITAEAYSYNFADIVRALEKEFGIQCDIMGKSEAYDAVREAAVRYHLDVEAAAENFAQAVRRAGNK